MSSAEHTSNISPPPGGRSARVPRAPTALACFFRRSRTNHEGKVHKDVSGRPQNGIESLVRFVRKSSTFSNTSNTGSRAMKLSSPEHRYSRTTSSPPGLFISRVSQPSATSVDLKATRVLETGEMTHVTTRSNMEGQHFGFVPPLCQPEEQRHLWPAFEEDIPYNDEHFTTSGVSFSGNVQEALQTSKTAACGACRGRETGVARVQGVEGAAETLPSTAASEFLDRSRKSGRSNGGMNVNEFESLVDDAGSPKTGKHQQAGQDKPQQTWSQHVGEQWPGARRAAVAGRLSTRRERPSQEKRRICLNGELSHALFAELGVAISCRKGLKRLPSNQDDFFAYSCDNWGLYGVFDGHGHGGHVVANFVQWHLPNVIHDFMSQTDNMRAALRFAFNKVDSMLKEASAAQRFDSAASGSTASVALHKRREKKLYVAYVGDSTVVLARRSKQGQLIAHTVTRDHRPDDPTERSRIESFGGEIRRPIDHVPYRVFVKGKDYPGLAMSRSMGDFMGHCAGVTTEPDVLELDLLEGRDELVIMCTDGVWEFISPHEAVEILSRYSFSQAADAVRALSCEAWKRWLDEDGHSVDDITVQLIHLFPPRIRNDGAQ